MYFYCEVLANLGLTETVNLAAGALEKAKNGADIPDKVAFISNLMERGYLGAGGTFSACNQQGIYKVGTENPASISDMPKNSNGEYLYYYGVLSVQRIAGVITQVYKNHLGQIATRQSWDDGKVYNNWNVPYDSAINKPTAADVGALTKTDADNHYVRQGSSGVVYKNDDLAWNSPTGAYLKENEGYTSLVWHMGLNAGSASSAQFYFDYSNGGLKYRSSRDNYGFEKPWARIYSDQDKPTADEIGAIAFHGGLSQDLNNVFTPGSYCNVYDAYATPEHNYPIAFAGSLFIYLNSANGNNGVTQEYRPYNSNKLFRRFYYASSSSWSVWVEEYNTQNKPTAEDVGALPAGGIAIAATKLATARKINGVLFDGTADINIASGWNKVASGSVNYPLVNSQTKSFVGTIDTGVATTSWIHDLKKYAVVLSSKGNQVVTSNPNNCSWGASAELRSMTRFYGNSTIFIDVFTYGQNLQSGSVSTWELWEVV